MSETTHIGDSVTTESKKALKKEAKKAEKAAKKAEHKSAQPIQTAGNEEGIKFIFLIVKFMRNWI